MKKRMILLLVVAFCFSGTSVADYEPGIPSIDKIDEKTLIALYGGGISHIIKNDPTLIKPVFGLVQITEGQIARLNVFYYDKDFNGISNNNTQLNDQVQPPGNNAKTVELMFFDMNSNVLKNEIRELEPGKSAYLELGILEDSVLTDDKNSAIIRAEIFSSDSFFTVTFVASLEIIDKQTGETTLYIVPKPRFEH